MTDETVTYQATIFDYQTGAEAKYEFQGPAGLANSRHKLIEAFMEYVDHIEIPQEKVDYEIQAAFKSISPPVVTCIGVMKLGREHADLPFMAMIAERRPR